MITLAICLQKGGVGKSTTTLAVGVELAASGERVLLIDLDPQANLTQMAGHDPAQVTLSMYDVLLNPNHGIHQAILRTAFGVDLAPATLTLASAELMLAGRIGRELALRTAIATITTTYDYVLIDTPPSLSLLTVNAMCAANSVVVPLQTHVLAMRAIPQLEESIRLVRQLNPPLQIDAIILTMVDRRTSLSQAIEAETRQTYGDLVLQATIPDTTRLAEAPAAGQPISIYAPGSSAAIAYKEVAQELRARYATRS